MSSPHQIAGTPLRPWAAPDTPPDDGVDRYERAVPAELVAALRDLAGIHGVPRESVLLAAHAKVLSTMTAEKSLELTVLTAGTARRCMLVVEDESWLALVARAGEALRAAGDAGAPTHLALDLSHLTGHADDTSAAAGHAPGTPAETGHALRTAFLGDCATLVLRLDYRRSDYSDAYAARLADYHLTALRRMVADPGGPHDAESLMSEAETARHIRDVAGPRRPLPAGSFPELFHAQVARRPDAVAAVHGVHRLTYRQLNTRANQIAHRLVDLGLRAEDTVAVVLERSLDWVAAMLGVFKAGGVYLPIRPDFPAERIGTQLDRGGCRLAVVEPASAAALITGVRHADRPCHVLTATDAYADPRTSDPDPAPAPGSAAYIYFTSGSTGSPKGAVCEHGGMLNHLLAKVDDLQLRAGDTVAQTASQCFDISLWQVAAPLLSGGCTEIVDTDVQLDVMRFVDRLGRGGVHAAQLVPSYLDAFLAQVERDPRPLGDLRVVSVTGEALRRDLVRRWFAAYPEIPLVNAYGATEVSDDTMHAVLHEVPVRESGIVHVGRSLRNVYTYILDERSRVVPPGAPGEIAFSGICVGRGYINDDERTARAFTADPYRDGERLYRTGDFGRFLPEGTIEFLGRRDEQVKIRGFRIELGEVENRLLQMPGIEEVAVIVHGDADQTQNLVAFITGSPHLEPADVRDFLAAALPEYMVPQYFHRLESLPLTENGKVNKRELHTLATGLGGQVAAYVPPSTPTEKRLATAWAEVLNLLVGQVGRDDDFFTLGATSLAAVRLVVKLDRLISLRDIVARPVLRDLAAVIDSARHRRPEPASGLLQLLSRPAVSPVATLVCFPYAGGNAVNFQRLAAELTAAGVTVYGVELPGHDVARPGEPLMGLPDVARRVCAELSVVDGPVLLWGHCTGAAYALECARLLEAQDRGPEAVFVGALRLDRPERLHREIERVGAWSDQEVTALLHDDSAYIELDRLKSERAELVGRTYRHDVTTSAHYLADLQSRPSGSRLRTPLHVVLTLDDPAVVGTGAGDQGWSRIAHSVTGHLLDEGGRYFIRSRAAAAAALVRAVCPTTAGIG